MCWILSYDQVYLLLSLSLTLTYFSSFLSAAFWKCFNQLCGQPATFEHFRLHHNIHQNPLQLFHTQSDAHSVIHLLVYNSSVSMVTKL